LPSGKIRILIADDHTLVREGTRHLLERENDLEVVAEAADGEEAIRLTGNTRPDVVIMDVNMPKMDGIAATKKIKELYPKTAVLVLSAYDDDQFVFNLIDEGAAGYLLKSMSASEIINAVRAVHTGDSVLHPTIARKVINRIRTPGKVADENLKEALTEREIEILKLATEGLSNQEIADKLSLSLRTVQAHFNHIFNKLEVSSRTEAVVLALKKGWIDLKDIPSKQ